MKRSSKPDPAPEPESTPEAGGEAASPDTPDTGAAPGDSAGNQKWNETKRSWWGLAAAGAWILVFAVGVLVPSLDYRKVLGWTGDKEKQSAGLSEQISNVSNDIKELQSRLQKLENKSSSKGDNQEPVQGGNSKAGDPVPADAPPREAPPPAKRSSGEMLAAFLVGLISFIPLNIALLCIIAGFLGGCTVSSEVIADIKGQLANMKPDNAERPLLERRLNYLTEEPVFSALRGLVMFLLLTSGLFVFAGTDAFMSAGTQEQGLGQYIKFAGMFSLIAYLAGHDPTTFSTLLRAAGGRLNGGGKS